MPIARVEAAQVVEQRDLSIDDIPAHKRAIWLPIEGDKPVVDENRYSLTGPVYQIEAGRVLRVWQTVDRFPDLAAYKTRAKARISAEAEAEREKYLTPGSGKALSYQKVKEEAERYVAMNGEGAYPFLQARVDSGRYPDLAAAAAGTLAIEGQWTVAGAAIDRKEDTAKLAIDAAANHAAVDAVRVTW